MKRAAFVALAAAALAASAGVARATLGPSELPPSWHIHDCAAAPCVFPHAAAGFFPRILTGGNLAAYLQDPARCPDATDKAFLGGGAPGPTGSLDGNQPLREGVCMTTTTVIHLKSIAPDQPAPDGWTSLGTSGGWTTYYRLTSA